MAESDNKSIASLNDLVTLVRTLKSSELRELLGNLGGTAASDCSYHCGCVHAMCGCNSSVTKTVLEDISYPEFMKQREARMTDLRARLESLESSK